MRFLKDRLRSAIAAALAVGCLAAPALILASGRQDAPAGMSEAEKFDQLFYEGQVVYGTSCVSCHDADGGDSSAPALSGHPSMGARDHIVRQILRGNAERGMPAFAATLTDRQVAGVATYIRNAWDNAHGVVLESDVKRVREETPGRK